MIHLAAIVAQCIWFGLTGLLWYAKPAGDIWLLGAGVLGVIWLYGFFRYVTRANK